MKNFVSFFLFCFCHFGFCQVDIKVSLMENCIQTDSVVILEYYIENHYDEKLYLQKDYLAFSSSIKSEFGRPKKSQSILPAASQPDSSLILLESKSTTTLLISSNFFQQYRLEPNVRYTFSSRYIPFIKKKKIKGIRLVSEDITINDLQFVICNNDDK